MPPDNPVQRFFDRYIPALQRAGRYALAIRDRIETRAAKDGDAWTSIVTDADLGVQHFLEATSLAEFPDWSFWGEEHAASFNTRYFDRNAPYQVAVDPINGTRLYGDGGDGFDIIASLSREGTLLAALSWMPARDFGLAAARAHGAFRVSAAGDMAPLRLDNTSMTLTVYKADPWLSALPSTVRVYDALADYDPADVECNLNAVLTGEIGGFLVGPTPLLDVGTTAFKVAQAGGLATLPDGSPLDVFERFDPARDSALLVCANPALHATVSRAIRHAGG